MKVGFYFLLVLSYAKLWFRIRYEVFVLIVLIVFDETVNQ